MEEERRRRTDESSVFPKAGTLLLEIDCVFHARSVAVVL